MHNVLLDDCFQPVYIHNPQLQNTLVTEQYFPAVLFLTLYKVDQIFESVDEILKCDNSNESY